jgi:anti-sigma-K factor RskA
VVGLAVSLNQSTQKQVFTVFVDRSGDGTLNVSGLDTAPSGKTYEAWVIPAGSTLARPAGLFSGGATTTIHLEKRVPEHATVAVTIERAGGSSKPTTKPIFSATA